MFALLDQRLDPDPRGGDLPQAAGKTDVAELEQAYTFLAPLLGSAFAPTLFGIALLVLRSQLDRDRDAGRADRDGGLSRYPLAAWARRLVTRGIAIVPAAIVTIWYGEAARRKLLILSQVMLSLQLPFAVVPLVMFTADKRKMGELVAPCWVTALAVLTAITVIVLNMKLLWDFFGGL